MRARAPMVRRVTVSGRVLRVRSHRAAGEIRPSHPMPLPRVGAHILLRGVLRYDEEHSWYAVDPVEIWIEPPLALFPR
jgi:hypothetical protein